MSYDVLAIGAHPDDIELGCGGAVASLTDKGYRVGLLDLTPGALATHGDPDSRRREAEEAAAILGVPQRHQLDLSETDILTGADSLHRLTGFIRRHQPYVILAPWWDDRHPDHNDASQLVQRAAFWAGVTRFGCEAPPHRPHRLMFYFVHRLGPASVVVDISAAFDRKLKAIRAFRSQFSPQPGAEARTYISRPEFLETLISRARHFGSLIGAQYGEPFFVREINRVDDIVQWAGEQGLTG